MNEEKYLHLKGTYGKAIVFTTDIEEGAVEQVRQFINNPAAVDTNVRVMPDAHQGAGCVIGFTAKITDKVVPNLIGVDIGCGVAAWKLGADPPDYTTVEQVIREHIPHGFGVRDDVYPAEHLYQAIDVERKDIHEYSDFLAKLDELSFIHNKERVLQSLGSLGGGNHFIEIDLDDSGNYWLVIHSGSRSLGLRIATYYQNLAADLFRPEVPDVIPDLAQIVADAKAKGEEDKIQERILAAKKLKAKAKWKPSGLEYLQGQNRDDYIEHMKLAQTYAKLNRRIMGYVIISELGIDYHSLEFVESVHNYIDFKDNVIRKGAISAHKDEKVVIPLNMKDGTIYGIGKGNPDWNYSAAHGAGRRMSRRQAKKKINMNQFQQVMDGVWSQSVSEATIDEAPQAYKDAESIVDYLTETIDVKSVMKAVYNFKSDDPNE